MRKLILSWILALVAIGGCVSYASRAPAYEPTPFELVCYQVTKQYGADCGELEPPVLVITSLVEAVGARGAYSPNENYIFVSPLIFNTREVIIHETVHYVLWNLELSRDRCDSERLAREWAAIITGTPLDTTWAKNYGCFQ